MKFLSIILIVLACVGFTAKLADKFSGTELMVKEHQETDDKGEKETKEKKDKQKLDLYPDGSFLFFSIIFIESCDQTSCSKGFATNPYNPPDLL
jgi:hypothetical protein